MKVIGITMGDPAGIGPELIVKLSKYFSEDSSYVIYSERLVLDYAKEITQIELEYKTIDHINQISSPGVYLINLSLGGDFLKPSENSGKLAIAYLARALADKDKLSAVLTMPISKYYAKLAGFSFNGQTEFLAFSDNAKDFAMMMYSDKIKVVLLSTHVPLKDVPSFVTEENIKTKIKLINNFFEEKLSIKPIVKVVGLNPHAGEMGQIGKEDIEIIKPSIDGFDNVIGPLPSDTAFLDIKENDVFLCMYHDQGLIPFKMLSFYEGTNVTIGLSFIRSSPDHGTAFDIAYKNLADPRSAIYSLKFCERFGKEWK